MSQKDENVLVLGGGEVIEVKTKKKKKKKKKKKGKGGGGNNQQVQVQGAGLRDDAFDEEEFKSLSIHEFFKDGLSLVHDEKKGRHVVADKKYAAGEVVFETMPFGAVPVDRLVDQICHRCFKPAEILYMCGGCKTTRFCSTNCMNAFSRTHAGLECKTYAKLQEFNVEGEMSSIRLLVRILILRYKESLYALQAQQSATSMNLGRSKKDARLRELLALKPKPGLSYADVNCLMCHDDDIALGVKMQLMMTLTRLEDYIEEAKEVWPGVAIATKNLLQIHVNAHHLTDVNKQQVGLALYPAASCVNHSCRPNMVYHFAANGKIECRALRDIMAGEEVTYAYIDLYQGPASRAARLKQVYYVSGCVCARCQGPADDFETFLDGFVCPTCSPDTHNQPNLHLELEVDMQTHRGGKNSEAKVEATVYSDPEDAKGLLDSKFTCGDCGTAYDRAELEAKRDEAQELFNEALQRMSMSTLQEARAMLEAKLLNGEEGKFLHRFHAIKFNAALALISISREDSDFTAQAKYARLCAAALSGCQLGTHPEMADVCFSLGEALVGQAAVLGLPEGEELLLGEQKRSELTEEQLNQKEALLTEAANAYRRAARVRLCALGKKHQLTVEAVERASSFEVRRKSGGHGGKRNRRNRRR